MACCHSPSRPLDTMPCTSTFCKFKAKSKCTGSNQLSILMRRSKSKSFISSSDEGMLKTLIKKIMNTLLSLSSLLTIGRHLSSNASRCHPSYLPAVLLTCSGRRDVFAAVQPYSSNIYITHGTRT